MRFISALPGDAAWGIQLARIASVSEHGLRIQRFPSPVDRVLSERKRCLRVPVTAHRGLPTGPDTKPQGIAKNGNYFGRPVLTPEQVLEIRDRLAVERTRRTVTMLAKRYGVKQRTIYDIANGDTWQSLLPLPSV